MNYIIDLNDLTFLDNLANATPIDLNDPFELFCKKRFGSYEEAPRTHSSDLKMLKSVFYQKFANNVKNCEIFFGKEVPTQVVLFLHSFDEQPVKLLEEIAKEHCYEIFLSNDRAVFTPKFKIKFEPNYWNVKKMFCLDDSDDWIRLKNKNEVPKNTKNWLCITPLDKLFMDTTKSSNERIVCRLRDL